MGTSSAFTVGLLKATTNKDNKEIASLATVLEREKTANGCGFQDQYICAVGGFKRLRFYGSGIVAQELDYDWLESYLMLFDTGIYRRGSQMIKHQLDRIEDNQNALHTIKELALTDYTDYKGFGAALDTAWKLKKTLSDDVSNKQVDRYYDMALGAGAVGGKLLGGGGGGFMVFVVPKDKQKDVCNALQLNQILFKFDKGGTRIIYDG